MYRGRPLDNGMPTVLVCYDGGAEARKALGCVANLLTSAPANLTVLFVRPKAPSGYQEMVAMAREKIVDWELDLPGLVILREAEEQLVKRGQVEEDEAGQPAKLRHGLRELGKGLLEVHFHGRHDEHIRLRLRDGGDAGGVILNELDSLPYDMVVMGSRGRKGLKRWVMGSTAQRVALFSEKTVLVVRGEADLQRVLVCSDGSEAAERAVRFVGPLAKAKGCNVTLFSVATDEGEREAAERRLDRGLSLLAGAGVTAASRIAVAEDRAEEIVKVTGEYDLTVLGVSGRSHIRRYLMGSVPLKVLEHSSASVMIVK
jgi:nucleotide-binding universal stress UspA family protein